MMLLQGAVVSTIGGIINTIVSAIATVIMTIVSAIVTVSVARRGVRSRYLPPSFR